MNIQVEVLLTVNTDQDEGADCGTVHREAAQTVCDALSAAGLEATVSSRYDIRGLDPRSSGGYMNQHGRYVPNPRCGEDSEGRDLDRIYRNIKPGDRWTKETLDRLASGPL